MSLEQDVAAARGAVDALERACASLMRYTGDTLDARRLRIDVARLRDDLDLLCGVPRRAAHEPFVTVYGDGDDEGIGGSGRTRR